MSPWVRRYGHVCRGLARAFPRRFRETCGDGLEVLVADVVPLVWRDQGVLGLARLTADLVLRLPMEYFASATTPVMEALMTGDLFEGTWKAVHDKSQWDPKLHAGAGMSPLRTDRHRLSARRLRHQGRRGRRRAADVDHRRRPPASGRRPEWPPDSRRAARRPRVRSASRLQERSRPASRSRETARRRQLSGLRRRQNADGDCGRLGLKGPFRTVATFERVRRSRGFAHLRFVICDLQLLGDSRLAIASGDWFIGRQLTATRRRPAKNTTGAPEGAPVVVLLSYAQLSTQ